MKRIAVLTSGGDAAGMNAAVRAVVRTGAARGREVLGVRHGYAGLIAGDAAPLGVRDVGGVIQRGGTMLGTGRCDEFMKEEGRAKALANLRRLGVDGLVVVGGNGSQTGAHLLSAAFPVVGVASTIDNDLLGSDITLGADTALDVALESIDRLKTTASSHGRAFLVETMGRKCGYIALMAGIAGGAECVVVPEIETAPEAVADAVRAAYDRGQAHAIVVVAEGARHDGDALAAYFREHRERLGFELRVTKLGHVQRGGAPGAFDRLLGTRLGAGAVDALLRGDRGVLVGLVRGAVATTPLADVAFKTKGIDPALFELARVLAT
jgi:6-phosphofructokinase 1